MFVLKRAIIANVLLLVFFSTSYPASFDKTEPVAQVYEIQGKAAVKSAVDGSSVEVKKGCLLGRDDTLTLEKDAVLSLYFKTGGKKDVRARDARSSYKVADLKPKAEAYSRNVPLFGATRGRMSLPETLSPAGDFSPPAAFFYPQEAVVLENLPVIEFTLFNGSNETVLLGAVTLRILKDGALLDSRKFNNLEYDTPYVYQPPNLAGRTEYSVELALELPKEPGSVVSLSFPLYLSGIPDTAMDPRYASFSDPVYRSFESVSPEFGAAVRELTLIKRLERKAGSPQPVIVIELFIT